MYDCVSHKFAKPPKIPTIDNKNKSFKLGKTHPCVKILNRPNGDGSEVGDSTITADESMILYAAGYDSDNNYIGDISINWDLTGQLNISDDLGNSFTEELLKLDPICADPTLYFNSETWKYIMLPYPLSESAFYSNNGIYPDTELNYLDLEFTDPISLEFIINDSIDNRIINNRKLY